MIDIQFHLKKKERKTERKLSGTGAQQKIKVILDTLFLFLNQENAQNEPLVESYKKKRNSHSHLYVNIIKKNVKPVINTKYYSHRQGTVKLYSQKKRQNTVTAVVYSPLLHCLHLSLYSVSATSAMCAAHKIQSGISFGGKFLLHLYLQHQDVHKVIEEVVKSLLFAHLQGYTCQG